MDVVNLLCQMPASRAEVEKAGSDNSLQSGLGPSESKVEEELNSKRIDSLVTHEDTQLALGEVHVEGIRLPSITYKSCKETPQQADPPVPVNLAGASSLS